MLRRVSIAVLLTLVALLPTWRFVFGGQVPAPVDWVHHNAPWNGPEPESAYDILAMDGALQFLPWRHYMLDSFLMGHVPLWNPNTLGGAPFLANSQSAPMYPLHWLWPFDAESLLGFSSWLHLFIAGLGVFALCRRLGGTTWGGLVAAISVQLSAFLIAWIALPSVGMTAAWIPWCLWGVLGVAQATCLHGPTRTCPSGETASGSEANASESPVPRLAAASEVPLPGLGGVRGGSTTLPRAIAALGACVGLMLLGGHLQIAAYGLLAVFAFLIWLLIFPASAVGESQVSDLSDKSSKSYVSRWRALWALAGIAIGVAIATTQLLPAIESGRQGHRAGPPTAEGWEAYKGSAATLTELVTLVSPDFYGTPQPRHEQTGATSYWLAYTKPGRHYAEIAFYVGPVVLPLAAFALVGIRRRPQVGFFAVLVLLGLAIALGTPIAQALYFGVPGWSATGSPARAVVLVTLGLCVLAGMGLRRDIKNPTGLIRWVPSLTFLLASVLVILSFQLRPPDVAQIFGKPSLFIVWVMLIPAILVVFRAVSQQRFADVALIGLACVGFIPLATIVPFSVRGEYIKDFPGKKELQEAGRIAVIGEDWPFLTSPTKTMAPPNTMLPYGIKNLGGYDSIIPAKSKAKLDDANGRDSAPPTNGNMLLIHPQADLTKLRKMGADAIMASKQFTYDLPVIYDADNWRLYKLDGPTDRPFFYHESYNHIKLKWEGDFREQSRQWLDSEDADGWEMSPMTFDFNEKTVVAIYKPHSYRLGLLLGMLGAACALALTIAQRRPQPA